MAACEREARFGSAASAPLLEKTEMLRLAMLAASAVRPDSAGVWSAPDMEPYPMPAMEGSSPIAQGKCHQVAWPWC
jgi:hypothetical protein